MSWPDAVFWSIVTMSCAAVAIVFIRSGGYIKFKDPEADRPWEEKTTTITFPEKKEGEG